MSDRFLFGLIIKHCTFTGDYELVECLIKNGANIKVYDALKWSPLHLAVWNGDLKITEILLDNISEESEIRSVLKSVTSKGSTPFKLAVTNGHAHILKLLIERGALNNQEEEETQALFVTAIKKGYLDVVKCLHKHGAKLGMISMAITYP